MRYELEEIKRTLQDIAFSLSQLIGKSSIATQRQVAEATMEARKQVARISAILRLLTQKEGEG